MERKFADRKFIIIGFFFIIGAIYLARLFYVQILVDKYILSANKLPLELENALPTPEQFKHFFIEEEEM